MTDADITMSEYILDQHVEAMRIYRGSQAELSFDAVVRLLLEALAEIKRLRKAGDK